MRPATALVDTPAARRPVLVLDADQPSALAIVRSLSRRGLQVSVAASLPGALAGRSRHAREALVYPDPLREAAGFVDWLAALQAARGFGLVVPVTERSLVPLARERARFDAQLLAIAPNDALEQALDKERTVALAQRLGIPVPRSTLVTRIEELAEAASAHAFPVVVKPARSVGQHAGGRVQLTVRYARNLNELQAQVRDALRYGSVLLQEYFRGDGVGIELIADRGTLRHVFQHRRLHEVPLTGGGSSLRISDPVVPALRDAAAALMRALGWHGVAMVEFKHDPQTGDFRLMEINGRFWGSLPLAVAAGADFPAMLHELMTSGQVAERPPARTGVVCRQLARDIDWLEHVLRKAAPQGLVTLPSRGQVLRDTLLAFSPRHHFDVQSLGDPVPGLVDLGRIARHQWQRMAGQLALRRRLAAELRAGSGRGRQAMARARRVLFLCHGNINRSALAHAYARSRHGGPVEFLSAGFHAPGGRPADPVMVEVAAAAGVDLAQWRSSTLCGPMIEQADLILAMELAHLDRLASEHPGARDKAYLLGAATARGRHEAEVPDPYGQQRATYERVCRQVLGAVDAWLTAPAARP